MEAEADDTKVAVVMGMVRDGVVLIALVGDGAVLHLHTMVRSINRTSLTMRL